MKYGFWLCFSLFFATVSFAQQLRIAVASNAQFVATRLKEAFKKETGVDAELNVGSSGKLTAQIQQGAPFDIFLSADMKYPQVLYSKGLTTAKPKVYAYGALVLWTIKKVNLTSDLTLVSKKEIQKIAIANPKLAPYGEAAVQALQKQNLLTGVQSKIVYGESVAQVNQYLLTGAADVAFTAKSVVLDPAVSGKGKWIEIDQKWYNPIAQGVVVVKQSNAAQLSLANQFYKFLFSETAKAVFKKYGYQ